MHKKKDDNYFLNYYLGKKKEQPSLNQNKILQKLLSAKALKNANDSRGLSNEDLMRMSQRLNAANQSYFDIDSYLFPFDIM